ncbi:hypothetical protein [Paraliobacillus ryukyuensis]|uniref:hypothetical protein n=1 Tax=Paraliobacillus ryukyuensis TaxID=200904 RepID=UPI001180C8A8|nr:hypothetical protein [Paraliobacillus ryukyuensis]
MKKLLIVTLTFIIMFLTVSTTSVFARTGTSSVKEKSNARVGAGSVFFGVSHTSNFYKYIYREGYKYF